MVITEGIGIFRIERCRNTRFLLGKKLISASGKMILILDSQRRNGGGAGI